MNRIMVGFLSLLLASPALQADDKSKDKPATPADEYKALETEYRAAQKEFQKAVREAKTPPERQKMFEENEAKTDQFAVRFLDLAEKNPKDTVALDALIWVVRTIRTSASAKDDCRKRAIDLVLRDYIGSEKLGALCGQLAYARDKSSEMFLRAVMEKSPNLDVQGRACLALAQYLKGKASAAAQMKQDSKKTDKEIEQLFERVVNEYGNIKEPLSKRTLADVAKGELFEIQHLAIGKPVPDIEGEDLDGKKLRLSDYRGKVVMLDFWGHW